MWKVVRSAFPATGRYSNLSTHEYHDGIALIFETDKSEILYNMEALTAILGSRRVAVIYP